MESLPSRRRRGQKGSPSAARLLRGWLLRRRRHERLDELLIVEAELLAEPRQVFVSIPAMCRRRFDDAERDVPEKILGRRPATDDRRGLLRRGVVVLEDELRDEAPTTGGGLLDVRGERRQ